MTHPSGIIQIVPESLPSTPSWMGEMAAMAQVLTHVGVLTAIQQRVRFARARFGHYDLIDFVVVLIGYALSGEPTLKAFYERLASFAEPFMALFGRNHLPHRATLSRFLAALDQPTVEALRACFQEDGLSRTPFASAFRPVWPDGRAVDGGRCGWDPPSRPPTRAPADGIVAHPPSSFRSGVCARLSGAQAGRSRAYSYGHPSGTYASMSGHGCRDQAMGITVASCCELSR